MTNAKTPLARMKPVDLHEVWPHEAQNFTPWLAEDENLRLLGETLGIELENAGTEVSVGAFSADLLALDTRNGSRVLIENQLERTDHSHLGQILTYAAGLDAPTVVWIARRFTDEHRAALEWLNNATTADFRFFGLEVEVWKIGDSARAPKFNIVAKPNDWRQSVSPNPPLTAIGKAQLDFWREFCAYASKQGTIVQLKTPRALTWMDFSIGRVDFSLAAVVSSSATATKRPELRAEFVLDGTNAKARFQQLENERDQILRDFGDDLEWFSSDHSRRCRIFVRLDVNWREPDRQAECHAWLLEKLDRLDRVFRDRVRKLP